MTCKSSTSENQRKFTSQIAVHFSGLKNLDKPHVFVFPELLVCLDCGSTEFVIPETELLLLGKDPAARGTTRSPNPEGSVDLSKFARKQYGMNSGIPFIKIADRVEVTVDLTGKRISGPPVVFKQ
jgi:hypothetical protein